MNIKSILVGSCLALTALMSRTSHAARAGEGVAGYFSFDDNVNHAVILPSNGHMTECWWQGSQSPGCAQLCDVSWLPVVSTSGFYTNDHYRHAVAITSQGQVWDCNYKPGGSWPPALDLMGTISPGQFGTITTGASYGTPDGYQHYVVGTSAGRIAMLRLNPYVANSSTITQVGPQSGVGIFAVTGGYNSGSNEWVGAVLAGTSGVRVSDFNGVPNTSAATSTFPDYTNYGAGRITAKFYGEGAFSWATTAGLWGHSWEQRWSFPNWYFNGQARYTFTYSTLNSFGAFAAQNTLHGIVGTSTGDVWDMRYDLAQGGVSYTLLGNFP